ncbi:MAG: MarR family transcriptional regulator [Eubacteriales bacterium]|nr:MarR family transcriptional regulator [Eubacteriales bacterium]
MHCKGHHSPPPEGMIGPRVNFLSKLIRHALNEAIAEQGLFSGQQDILFAINNNEGMTVGELSKKIDVSVATASVSVKRMEKAGFIVKKPDEKDARIIRLYPTEKAKAAPEKIQEHMDNLENTLSDGMTAEESALLSSLLEKSIQNMLNRGDDND